jgi:hypothetical protein
MLAKSKQTSRRVVLRSPDAAAATPSEAILRDREWFLSHPGEDCYIREFVPGEFNEGELPPIPPGFRYATYVRAQRCSCGCGAPLLRHRSLMAVQP